VPAPRRAFKPSSDGILEAAEAAFARHGYNDISLRQLIAASRVSTTAFYARFDSKEAVLAALTSRLFRDLHADAPAVLNQARDLETGIDHGVELLCERFAPRKALVRLILSEAGSSPAAVQARRDSYGLLAAFLAMRFTALSDKKRIAIADPSALAWSLIGALEIQIVRWAVWDEIDIDQLRAQLRLAARAILPRTEKRHG
jgi:AcrR family transcriptional regulator